jgi:putative ABC transport system permease protein
VDSAVLEIPLPNLAIALLPVGIVLAILHRWHLGSGAASYALARMLIQLVLIGYVLTFIFAAENGWLIALVLSVMLVASSWIAMRPLGRREPSVYLRFAMAIALGSLPTLVLVTQAIVGVEPWYEPRYVVPLAGMIFASAMNTVSLAAERYAAETPAQGIEIARQRAFQAALIPMVNSLLAVGLVSLPGMMTGQILSGVSPLVAARYQIVVMCMLFGASGISAACYLWLAGRAAARAG